MSCLIGVLACGIGPTALTPTLVVMLGAMPLVLLREMLRDLAFGQLQIMRAVAIDAAVAALQLGALGLLAQTGLLTVELVYAVMGGACATACLGWFLAKRQPLAVERRRVLADWRENWSFAKWALAGQLLGRATSYLLPWLVALAHGEVATGLLAACITLVNLAGTFIAGVSRFLTPKAAQAFADEGARALNRVLGKAALIFLATLSVFCAAMLFAGDRVVVVVYGPSYAGAGTVMSILALAMLADSLGITAGNGLWAIDQPQANFVADAATFVVTIALVICLVGPVGVAGAAWAMLGGALAGVGIRAGTYWKLCPQADLSSG
jgi:O-antigen/teichoic acid export membrane protein